MSTRKSRHTQLMRAVTEVLEARQLLDAALSWSNPDNDRSLYADIQVQQSGGLRWGEPLGAPAAFSLLPSYVTAVRNQGNSGSCWTFATYASVESGILLAGGGATDMSENNLKDYHGFDWGPNDGGNSWISEAYLSRGSGPISEALDPYHDWDDRVYPVPNLPRANWVTEMLRFDTMAEIKDAVMTRGALYTSMMWSDPAYRASDSTFYFDGSQRQDGGHAVTIVGWDDAKVTAAPTPGAWLIKNSWGTGWGNQGYFWMSYADVQGGKTAEWFGGVKPADTYRSVYYWDAFGDVDQIAKSRLMNRFVATSSEDLAATGFFTEADGAAYTITVYDDLVAGVGSGVLASFSGTAAYAGWHTVDLPTTVTLTAGDDFYVAVTLTNGGAYPHAIERPWIGYASNASADPGQSFYSDNGTNWLDLTSLGGTYAEANATIKAYTKPPTIIGVDLAGAGFTTRDFNSLSGKETVDFVISNFGNQAAGAFDVTFYLSEDDVVDPATDILLSVHPSDANYNAASPNDFRITGINPRQLKTFAATLSMPTDDPFRSDYEYYVGMVIDPYSAVAETWSEAEENNSNAGKGVDGAALEYVAALYEANMDSDPEWKLDAGWAYGQPMGSWGDPSSGHTGTNVVGYNLSGAYQDNMSAKYATTTAINATGVTKTKLVFYRWLGVESNTWDHATVEVSRDGYNFSKVWENNNLTANDAGWVKVTLDISKIADNQPTVFVRWGMGPTDFSVTYGGWNIDDVMVLGRTGSRPPTSVSLSTTDVPEGASGRAIATISTNDPDENEVLTYSLVTGIGSVDNKYFKIVGNQLQTLAYFDYELRQRYDIRIRATEASGLYCERTFPIKITNVNEAPKAVFLSGGQLAENSAIGSVVGSLTSEDPDGDSITYELMAGPGGTDNGLFQLVGNQLRSKVMFDYETKSMYSVRIGAKDPGGLSFQDVFTISVLNRNDPPTGMSLSNATIVEGTPAGAQIGMFTTTDQDNPEPTSFTLVAGEGSTDNASFEILGIWLKSKYVFDRETKPTMSIRVRAQDLGGNWYEKPYVITVSNVNERPTNLTLSKTSVQENLAAGSLVGQIVTVDGDTEDVHLYALVDGEGSTDNALFTVQGDQLRTKASFNYETKKSYSIRLQSMDIGGYVIAKSFTISVTNVDERPIAKADTITTNGYAKVVVPVLTNDSEPEGQTIHVSSVGNPAHGWSTLNADGTITYAPVLGYKGSDSFTYVLSDSAGNTSTGKVSVNVTIPQFANVVISGTPNADVVELSVVNGALRSALNGLVRQFVFAGVQTITVNMGGSNDKLIVGASLTRGISVTGSIGNDTMLCGSGADTVSGGDGDDLIRGGAGNDRLDGGNGRDKIIGDAGNDYMDGKDGIDTLEGLGGNDTIYGGLMGDSINGWDDADALYGGAGNDTILGGNGNDRLYGETENDSLRGGAGDDTLVGGDGVDWMDGEDGKDSLSGGLGNDTLTGGVGADTLLGEDGSDLFWAIDSTADRVDGGIGSDSAHRDNIDLLLGIETVLLS